MKLFGFEITRIKPERPPAVHAVSIEDWLQNGYRPGVTFEWPYNWEKNNPTATVRCSLTCRHEENTVTGHATGSNPQEALENAIRKLEETISPKWRKSLPVVLHEVQP